MTQVEECTDLDEAFDGIVRLVSMDGRNHATQEQVAQAVAGLPPEDFPGLYRRLLEYRQKKQADYDAEVRNVCRTAESARMFGNQSVSMDDFYDRDVSAAHIALGQTFAAVDRVTKYLRGIETGLRR